MREEYNSLQNKVEELQYAMEQNDRDADNEDDDKAILQKQIQSMESQIRLLNEQLYSIRTTPQQHSVDIQRLERENAALTSRITEAYQDNSHLKQ